MPGILKPFGTQTDLPPLRNHVVDAKGVIDFDRRILPQGYRYHVPSFTDPASGETVFLPAPVIPKDQGKVPNYIHWPKAGDKDHQQVLKQKGTTKLPPMTPSTRHGGYWSMVYPATITERGVHPLQRHEPGVGGRPMAVIDQNADPLPQGSGAQAVLSLGPGATPPGTEGIVVGGTDIDEEYYFFLPTPQALIAHHNPDNPPFYSTQVADMAGPTRSDKYVAGLHTAWAVCLNDTSVPAIAINATQSAGDSTGWAFMRFSGYRVNDPSVATQAPSGAAYVPDRVEYSRKDGIHAYGSWERFGPFHPGAEKDKHLISYNSDGEPVNSLHLWTNAYWWHTPQKNAPLEFSDELDPECVEGWIPYRGYICYNDDIFHDHETGPKKGLWRIHMRMAFEPPEQPPPPPKETKPPTSKPETGHVSKGGQGQGGGQQGSGGSGSGGGGPTQWLTDDYQKFLYEQHKLWEEQQRKQREAQSGGQGGAQQPGGGPAAQGKGKQPPAKNQGDKKEAPEKQEAKKDKPIRKKAPVKPPKPKPPTPAGYFGSLECLADWQIRELQHLLTRAFNTKGNAPKQLERYAWARLRYDKWMAESKAKKAKEALARAKAALNRAAALEGEGRAGIEHGGGGRALRKLREDFKKAEREEDDEKKIGEAKRIEDEARKYINATVSSDAVPAIGNGQASVSSPNPYSGVYVPSAVYKADEYVNIAPLSTPWELSVPSIIGRAYPITSTMPRWDRYGSMYDGSVKAYHMAPFSAHIQFFAKETPNSNRWDYTTEPNFNGNNDSRLSSGTADGGAWVTPPEIMIGDATLNPDPATHAISQTQFALHPQVSLAWGVPDDQVGQVVSGWRLKPSAYNTDVLNFEYILGTGAVAASESHFVRFKGGVQCDYGVTLGAVDSGTITTSNYLVIVDSSPAHPLMWWDGSAWQTVMSTSTHPDPHRLSDGTVTAPTYSFSDETDTGMWRNPAGFDGGTTVVINAAGIAALEVGTTGVYIPGKLTVDGLIDPTGLVLTEQASTPWTPAAGFGAIYVKNTAPSTLIFVDDTGAEFTLGTAGGGLADPGSNGIVVRTSAGVTTARTIIAPAAGITIADGDGVLGNPTLSLSNDLAALEGLGSTGYAVRTAANTWAQRTVGVGSNSGLAVTNNDGVAGNTSFVIDHSSLAAGIGAPGLTLLMAAGTTTPSSYSVQQVLDATGSLSTLVDTTLAVTDSVPVYDLSATALKRMVIDEFMGGSISVLTADASPDSAADYVATFDASAGVGKKVLLSNLPSTLNISGLTAETGTIDDVNDYIPFYDASATANKKISPEYLFSVVDQLTQLTAVAVGDIVPIVDISAGAPKARYSTVEDLFDAVAGFTTLSGIAVATGSYDMIPLWDTSAAAIRQCSTDQLGIPLVAYCSGDQSVASTTQTNATGMVLTLAGSAWYSFEMYLKIDAGTSAGFKFDLDGGTVTVTSMSYLTEIATTTGFNVIALATTALATDVTVLSGASGTDNIVRVVGHIQTNVGGTLQLRFSRTGASNSATLNTGSWMRCQRMA